MIYTRTNNTHHPITRSIALLLTIAMLVLGFMAYPPVVHATTVWVDPVGLPALDSASSTSRSVPTPLNIEIDGSFPVSATTSPTLVWKSVPTGVSQVTFKIVTLASTTPQTLWNTTVSVGANGIATVRVPTGVLKQGHTYGWGAESKTNANIHHGPFKVTVDVQRASVQPTWAFGGVHVAEATGELIYTWSGPQLSTLAGPIGWNLVHRPTNPTKTGLPTGWNLALSGTTGWESLTQNTDGSVTLISNAGGSVTYTKRGADQWKPAVGGFQTAGATTLLTQNTDGTFSATDGNRTVTVFSKPTTLAPGHPAKVWSLNAPTVQQQWDSGRLQRLVDPVTENEIVFAYGGNDICPTDVDAGFIAAPAGDLCAVVDWAGNTILIEYVQTQTGPQIGRIVSGLGMGRYAQSYDIAWNHSNNIIAVRDSFAATVIASGAVPGLDAKDARVTTQITYDAQGRVASLTAPEGFIAQAEQPAGRTGRAEQSFTYAPFTVHAKGVQAPVGSIAQTWLDPVSFHVDKVRNESGNVVSYEYDARGNQIRTTDHMSGTVTETRYDAEGRPVEQLGPTKGSLTSPTTPRTSTDYDQNENGKDWTGLATRYYDNAGFNGQPTGGTTGPVMPGSTTPVTGLSLNWSTNPAGTGSWSARLTGTYQAPADGPYSFTNTTTAQLWINGNQCAPACKVTLAKDSVVAILIDVKSETGGAAGINTLVTTPDGKSAPIPTANLRPNYNLATSTSTRERVASGGTEDLQTKNIYNPTTTQLVATVAPSGARQTREYEAFNEDLGQWGRSTSVTDASGKKTTMSYYAKDAVATDCQGTQIAQEGQLQSTNLPGGSSAVQVGLSSGGTVKATDGPTTLCGSTLPDNAGFAATTTGIGPEVTQASHQFVNGNPLVVSSTTTTQGKTFVETSKLDSNGNVWETIDAHGTKTIQRWNPYTENVDQIIETTTKGETRTTNYTYAPNSQVATVVVNGHTLLTNEYATNGGLTRSVLGNGAVQTFELDAHNNGRKTTTTFPDGTVLSEIAVHSTTGRLLSRTVNGPTGSSTFEYSYNVDGRLVDTHVTGTIPTRTTAWHNEYVGPDGLNGNRASKTATNADGTKVTTEFTYGTDNRLLTASNGRIKGEITYDEVGRATKIGGASLSYDAAGHLLSAAEGNRLYTFTGAGDTTTLTQTIDGAASTISATSSGQSLVLGVDGKIDAQSIGVAQGVTAILDHSGVPIRWVYDDMLGNGTWTSKGTAAPTKTHLYAPGGEPISVDRVSAPKTSVDLIVDGLGWMSGNGGATTLRLATPLSIIGARVYTPDGGRWLQPDPDINGGFNAFEYALGDPINQVDPSGHAPWGWIAGAIASVVIGVAIGALTFGIGVGGAAAYGYAAIAAQVALGAITGAIAGVAGEVVTQLVNNGGASLNWASIGIAAGIGAAFGGISTGISSASFKIFIPGRKLRHLAAATPADVKTASRMRAYSNMKKAYKESNDSTPKFFASMFTGKSWKSVGKEAAKIKARQTAIGDIGTGIDDFVMGVFNGAPRGSSIAGSIDDVAPNARSFATASSNARPPSQIRAGVGGENIDFANSYSSQVKGGYLKSRDVSMDSSHASHASFGENPGEFQKYLMQQLENGGYGARHGSFYRN